MWLPLVSFLCFAQVPSPPVTENTPVASVETVPEPDIRFLHPGGLQGIGAERYVLDLSRILKDLESHSLKTSQMQQFRGLLRQKDWILMAEDQKVDSLLDFLKEGNISCKPETTLYGYSYDQQLLLSKEKLKLTHNTYQQDRCSTPTGRETLLLYPQNQKGSPSFKLEHFDFRKGVRLQFDNKTSAYVIISAIQDGNRIQHHILEAQKNNVIYVDAGSFVDSWSNLPERHLSLNRQLAYDVLESLSPAALGLGRNELLGGAKVFFEEIKGKSLPYIATNWKTPDMRYQLPKSRQLLFQSDQQTYTIAFVSLLSPTILDEIPLLKEERIEITDPITALHKEVEALFSSPSPPDVVFLLTQDNEDILQEVRRRAKGVTLMLGDASLATLKVKERGYLLKAYSPNSKGAPITLPMDGLNELELYFDQHHLNKVLSRPIHITDDRPIEQASRTILNKTRAKVYGQFSNIILKPNGAGVAAKYTTKDWNTILCEAVRHYTQADSVLLAKLPPPPQIAGSITELLLLDHLKDNTPIEEHWILGSKLKTLLTQSHKKIEVSCGARYGNLSSHGRKVEPDRYYKLITTEHTRMKANIGGALQSAKVRLLFDEPTVRQVKDESGHPITLNKTILLALRKIRNTYGLEKLNETLMTVLPSQKPPLWLLRVRQIGVSTEQFGGMENSVFASVPDTMANAASSSSLGGNIDIAIDYTSTLINQDLRFRTSYGRLQTNDAEQEISDDWTLSSSLSIPKLKLVNIGPFSWGAFTEILYDSEYTATEQEDGTLNPKQADLSLSLGMRSKPWKSISAIRISGFGNRDLSDLSLERYEYGIKIDWESKQKILSHIIWSTTGDLRYYTNTPEDNESDLRFRAFAETRFSLPLTHYLALSLYGQALGIQGRLESTKDVGFASNIGLSFDVLGIFDL